MCNTSTSGRRARSAALLVLVGVSQDPGATAEFWGIPDLDAWETDVLGAEY